MSLTTHPQTALALALDLAPAPPALDRPLQPLLALAVRAPAPSLVV